VPTPEREALAEIFTGGWVGGGICRRKRANRRSHVCPGAITGRVLFAPGILPNAVSVPTPVRVAVPLTEELKVRVICPDAPVPPR
jgi:hypothetical protein